MGIFSKHPSTTIGTTSAMKLRTKFILFTNAVIWFTGVAIVVAAYLIHRASPEGVLESSRGLLIISGKILLVMIALSAVISGVARHVADVVGERLKALKSAAAEVEQGNFDIRLPGSRDEFGFFSIYFNRMAERLAELDQLKDDFISGVSHDLRGPLTVIQMWIRFFFDKDPKAGEITPEHKRLLDMILDIVSRHELHVSNMLDAAKIKAGRIQYDVKDVSLEDALKNAYALYTFTARSYRIRFDLEVEGSLPQVKADAEYLEHAIMNLVSNALKFTPKEGRIMLAARSAGDRAEVIVADTGRGISEEDQKRLFQRFRQFGPSEQREKSTRGTGLGLYLVKQSVEAMGGSISVRSKPRQGTRFTLTIPTAGGAKTSGR